MRKLAWILPEIPPGTAALSLGAAGSNHLVATGLYCRQRGLPFEAVLVPQPETPHVRDNLRRTAGLTRLRSRVHAVRVSARVFSGRRQVHAMALRTAALLRRHGRVRQPARDRLVIRDEVFAPGYGRSNPATDAAVRQGIEAGLVLEHTYTGKALAACLGALRRGEIDGPALFVNTRSERAPPVPDDPLPPALAALLQAR